MAVIKINLGGMRVIFNILGGMAVICRYLNLAVKLLLYSRNSITIKIPSLYANYTEVAEGYWAAQSQIADAVCSQEAQVIHLCLLST